MRRHFRLSILCAVLAGGPVAQSAADVFPTGPVAGGGAFVMQTCGESGSAAGWTLANPQSGTLAGGTECPPRRGNDPSFPGRTQQSGLWVSDRLLTAGAPGDTPADARVELRFAAAPDTTITRIRYWRMVSKDFDDDWHPYIARDAAVMDTCSVGSGSDCFAGADSWAANDEYGTISNLGYADLQHVSTTGIVVGLDCTPNITSACGNGSTITSADAAIYSAFFTIADPSPPTVHAPSGDGWTTTDWAEGTLPLAVSSNDNTGIAATRVYADGSLIATLQRTCSYDRPVPCSDEPTGAVGLPTAGLADGPHTIRVGAVDAAGNEWTEPRPQPLLVDNRAPAAPNNLASPAPTLSVNRFSASWSLPADLGTPIVGARYQLCQAGWCEAPADAPSLTGVDGLALPGAGEATLRVWLVDQRGHADPARGATLTLAYQPPPAALEPSPAPITPPGGGPGAGLTPRPPLTPGKIAADLRLSTTRRVGRRVTVSGRLTRRASGRVTVRYGARIAGRTRATQRRASVRKGRFSLTFTLPKAFAHTRIGSIVVTYGGDADTRSATRRATLRLAR